jgi:hypothetical protein
VFAVESPRNPRWTNDEMRAVPFGPNTSESKRYRTKTVCTVRLWCIVLAQAPDFFRTVQKPAAVCTVIVFQQETRSVDYSEHVIISKQEMVGAPPRNKKKGIPGRPTVGASLSQLCRCRAITVPVKRCAQWAGGPCRSRDPLRVAT